MDKLQPILRNHFWILAVLVLPIVLYGYYSANGALKKATDERETALDGVLSGVSSGNEPNQDYVDKLEYINTFYKESVEDTTVELWRHQQKRMVWPSDVADKIPDEFMGQIDQQTCFIYKGIYEKLLLDLMEHVQPVKPVDPMSRTTRRPGRVSSSDTVNQKVILATDIPQSSFGQFGITSQEMWDAQIDIWLTRLLMDAIVKVNEDKQSVTEAVIRQIDKMALMGGTGTPTPADAGMGGGMGGEMGMDMGGMEMGLGGATAGVQIPKKIEFSPAEEFGPASEGGGSMSMEMSMDPSAGGAAAAPTVKRYIGESESAPYLERGFYLSLIIQQNKIPDFIVTLANSDWPVRVVRFQVGTNPHRVEERAGGMRGMPYEMEMGSGMSEFSGANDLGGFSGGMESGMFGSGGFGMAQKIMVKNPYNSNLPEFATAALNHPDLVQLDLCGVITMYKQPTEAIAALEARQKQQPSGSTPAGAPAGMAPESAAAPVDQSPDALSPADGAATPAADAAMTPAAEAGATGTAAGATGTATGSGGENATPADAAPVIEPTSETPAQPATN